MIRQHGVSVFFSLCNCAHIHKGVVKMTIKVGRLMFIVVVLALLYLPQNVVSAQGTQPSLIFPFRDVEQWYVYQGYNNGTHNGTYAYSFDLTELNEDTEGRDVVSPVNGTVAWGGVGTTSCDGTVAIRTTTAGLGPEEQTLYWYVQLAHMKVDSIVVANGSTVTAGQTLIGKASNALCGEYTIPHIHLSIYKGVFADSGAYREAAPFENLEGFAWPSDGSTNQYRTTTVWRGMTSGDVGTIPTPVPTTVPTAVPVSIPTGTKRLVQRDFMVERTNPKVTEELQFAVDIANDGEVAVKTTTCNIFNYILLCL